MRRYEEPNDGKHIDDIIARTECKMHQADKGSPCWYIRYSNTNKEGPGICNARVKAAGFNGKIKPNSLRQRRANGDQFSRS